MEEAAAGSHINKKQINISLQVSCLLQYVMKDNITSHNSIKKCRPERIAPLSTPKLATKQPSTSPNLLSQIWL